MYRALVPRVDLLGSERAAGVTSTSPSGKRTLTFPLDPVTKRRSQSSVQYATISARIAASPTTPSPFSLMPLRYDARAHRPSGEARAMVESSLGRVIVAEAFDERGLDVLRGAGVEVVSCISDIFSEDLAPDRRHFRAAQNGRAIQVIRSAWTRSTWTPQRLRASSW